MTMKYYSLCSAALLVGDVSASITDRENAINLRNLQDATRPPKPTPLPTPAATRPPKTPPPTPVRTRPPKTPAPVPVSQSPTTAAPFSPSPPTIAQIVCSSVDFFTLCSYLEITGLYDILNSSGTYTLFAADNAAFEKLASVADLTDDEIAGLLLYHIAPNMLTYNNLVTIAPGDVETLVPGLPIGVSTGREGEVLLNGKVKITSPDIEASNGIIQVVDQIIVPPINPPTPVPITPEPTLKPTEMVTPAPTLKPTEAPTDQVVTTSPSASPVAEVITSAPTLSPIAQTRTSSPTLSPTAQVVTMTPTLEPSTKLPTSGLITESPTQSPVVRAETPAPTIRTSIIDPTGTLSPTRRRSSIFSKSGKSGSKSFKTPVVGKSSKQSSKSSKRSVEGKSDKSASRPTQYSRENLSLQEANGYYLHGRLNARFKADWNASSSLRGVSSIVMMAIVTTAAWFWQG